MNPCCVLVFHVIKLLFGVFCGMYFAIVAFAEYLHIFFWKDEIPANKCYKYFALRYVAGKNM